ncbi:MAG: phosphoadenylyl-sulfate reductase [Nitrososphaerales archaeon]
MDENEVKTLAEQIEPKDPEQVLEWAIGKFPRIALSSSFGMEDVVIIDMLSTIKAHVKIVTLDTGRLPQETYDVMDAIREKYGLDIEVYFPETASVEKMVREHGLNLFYQSVEFRKLCCGIRKIEPLRRALTGLDAWITGLRRDQVQTRTRIGKVELDADHGFIAKINPLADWSWEKVRGYVDAHQVPYNKLHDKGFPSLGCAPCTRAVEAGEDPRAGRWWWELGIDKECGIHSVAGKIERSR